ncbi:hypothetical protein L198_07120 [Cryptococcus wingfieldii CBS 7118]|uniref:Uncharacterized protein n=1 Tax=Cryptococcus wingfieldii CBS 7118 TaxID=1295528 RepID=A0A1E3IF26_9TREE|nr:hypothetical protein L198_07120 [Cryptococcus wingfieldii CBS 7118]ODN87118.1 hypothetical protein L198_07120 [Cryptococcus wingfieldii CBS 7118]
MSSKPTQPDTLASQSWQVGTNPNYELDNSLLEQPVMTYYSPLGGDHHTSRDFEYGTSGPQSRYGGDGKESGFRSGSGWPGSTHPSQPATDVNPFSSPEDLPEDKPPSYATPSTNAEHDGIRTNMETLDIEEGSRHGTRTADGRKRGGGPKLSTVVAGGITLVVIAGFGAGAIAIYESKKGGSHNDTASNGAGM